MKELCLKRDQLANEIAIAKKLWRQWVTSDRKNDWVFFQPSVTLAHVATTVISKTLLENRLGSYCPYSWEVLGISKDDYSALTMRGYPCIFTNNDGVKFMVRYDGEYVTVCRGEKDKKREIYRFTGTDVRKISIERICRMLATCPDDNFSIIYNEKEENSRAQALRKYLLKVFAICWQRICRKVSR